MAASTITRDTWADDTGSAASPNADGTVLANTILQNNIYARIDEMFSGAGSYTTTEFGGILEAVSFRDPTGVACFLMTSFGSIANNGTQSLTQFGTAQLDATVLLIIQGTGGFHIAGLAHLRGSDTAVLLIYDAAGNFTTTAGSANKINVYWDAGDSRYELENKTGVSVTVRAFYLRSA